MGRESRTEERRRASIERMKTQIRREGAEAFNRRTLELTALVEPLLRKRYPDHPALRMLDAQRAGPNPVEAPVAADRPSEVTSDAGGAAPTSPQTPHGSEIQLHLGLG